jgi:hypothetical protein
MERRAQATHQTTLDLNLTKLTVVKRADIVGRDEVMLWTMFIELSLNTINSRQFVHKTDPLAGKLGKAGKGDSIIIPASVGRFHNANGGIGMIGVAVIAFDNDLRSKKQIKDGYDAGSAALNQAIIDHFPKFGFAEVSDEERAEIEGKVRAAIKAAVLADSWFLTLTGGKPVGGGAFTKELVADSIDEPFSLDCRAKKDRAIYHVDGRLKFVRT